MSASANTPRWSRPDECRCGCRTNASISAAIDPEPHSVRAASIRSDRERRSRPAAISRRRVAAYAGFLNNWSASGTRPSGIHSAADVGQCSKKRSATVPITAHARPDRQWPLSA
ncbi:hypothetical protein W823_03875 [Williamsia sp. D3]|nr:hypothetical protein W823_03875 [Williamsia sp. D3]